MGATAGSLAALRELNRLRIVDALRRYGTASRSDLARATGLSRTTVSSLVADLQAQGLIVERAESDGQSETGRGRPPVLLRLNASAGVALGVDFGHQHIRVAVADLSSTVLAERSLEIEVDEAAAVALDAAVAMVDEVLADAGLERDQVVGAGMGVPGPIDRRTDTVGSAAILPGWVGVNPGSELAERLGLHVEVDNDANLGALAEVSFGAGRGLSDVVYAMLSSGVGAGLVLDGRLYRGAAGLAGELGHVQVQPHGALCRCGSRGCLEAVASSKALLEFLRPAHGSDLTVPGMLRLVAAGDSGATRAVKDAGRVVGRVLADLCNHLNPAAVIVGGELSAAGAPLLDGIREEIDRYALPAAGRAVEVKAGVLGARAGVLGALALVIGDTERLRSAGLTALAG
jgi:predicted NBD/HSP70 family sugar kinase